MDSLQKTINEFLDGLNTKNTQLTYGTALNKHFCAFLQEHGIGPEQDVKSAVTVDLAIRFAPWMKRQGFSAKSLKLYLTAIYRFYRYLLKLGFQITEGELVRLQETYRDARDIRVQERPIEHRLSDVAKVVQAARGVEEAEDRQRELGRLRDIAIVETLRATGCRVGELVGLRLSDFGPYPQCALVKGKGNKWRQVYWDNWAWSALWKYAHARELVDDDTDDIAQQTKRLHECGDAPLFVGHAINSDVSIPLTTRSVSNTISRLAEVAGVQNMTPHYFRHVFATRVLEKTSNLALLQDMMGHASPVTTRVYAQTDGEQRRRAHAQAWE